jgi:hypothetical protein
MRRRLPGTWVVPVFLAVGATLLSAAAVLPARRAAMSPPDQGAVPTAASFPTPAPPAPSPTTPGAMTSAGSRADSGRSPSAADRVGVAPRPTASAAADGRETAPVMLTLPGRAGARVVPMGVSDGRLAVPDSVSTLGWWSAGAGLNAAAGSIVVVGHVDAATQGLGYFSSLSAGLSGRSSSSGAGTRHRTPSGSPHDGPMASGTAFRRRCSTGPSRHGWC